MIISELSFSIPSGPGALWGERLAICVEICSFVIVGGSGRGLG